MLLCDNYFQLVEKTMIGGDYKELYWKLRDMDHGGFINCNDVSLKFSLTEYSNRSNMPLLEIDGVPLLNSDGSTEFLVILNKTDTEELFGKYIYQITVILSKEKQQSFQGIFNILKNVNSKQE